MYFESSFYKRFFVTSNKHEYRIDLKYVQCSVCHSVLPATMISSDPPSQCQVLGHESDSLGMNGAEHAVLEESDEVGLGSFLEGHNGGCLEPHIVGTNLEIIVLSTVHCTP